MALDPTNNATTGFPNCLAADNRLREEAANFPSGAVSINAKVDESLEVRNGLQNWEEGKALLEANLNIASRR